jgi:hypothetical protein
METSDIYTWSKHGIIASSSSALFDLSIQQVSTVHTVPRRIASHHFLTSYSCFIATYPFKLSKSLFSYLALD